jgi:hypothetical protein
VRPKIGTLTLSFGNVAAYESFDPERPFDSRQITHNLNRIWSAAQLDGQHFKRSSAELAIDVALNLLGHFNLIDRELPPPAQPPRRFELLRTHVVKQADFRFARPVIGFETFAKDELIATDGDEEIRSPLDDCTIFMPTRQPIVGREGVYLTRPMR